MSTNNEDKPPKIGDGFNETDVLDIKDSERKSLFSYYITNQSPNMWMPIESANLGKQKIKHRRFHNFYRVSSDNESLKEIYLSVFENFILLSKALDQKPSVCLDVFFATIKYSYTKDKLGAYYSIKVIKNDKFEEFVSYNKTDIDKLFKYLSRFCIQTSIQRDYTPMYGLGKGAFCKVFQAKKNDTGEEVAVKVYETENIYTAKQQEWVLNEFKIQMVLNNEFNKHNQRIIGIYEGKKYIYVVNRLAKGGEQLDYMVENLGNIEDIDSLRIIYSVCKSLEYLKKKQIIHRDIKPSNILRKDESSISDLILIDFGQSIQQKDLRNLKKNKLPFCVGTPGYIAPEMLEGRNFDTQSDIWSLGCLFYLLQTGFPLFSAKKPDDVLQLNRKCKINLEQDELLERDWYPPLVLEQLKGMLTKNPDERQTVEDILNHDIMQIPREEWDERELKRKEEIKEQMKKNTIMNT